jgi:hypothetical protein
MNYIRQKDVETYVRNLIFEKFQSGQSGKKCQHQDKELKTRISSKSKAENPTKNTQGNRIVDNP